MNLKKKMLIIIPIVMFLMATVLFQCVSNAETPASKWFGITALRTRDTKNLGYSIGQPKNGAGGKPIWAIMTYKNAEDQHPTQSTAYCLRAGCGFAKGENKPEEYNMTYDMLTERDKIKNLTSSNEEIYKDVYKNLVEGGHYNQILALLDMFYIPDKSSEEDKTALLDAAGIPELEYDVTYELTDNDIEAVQQAALWYFANYGDQNYNKYDETKESLVSWLFVTEDGDTYEGFSGWEPGTREGQDRNKQAVYLYNYLIDAANKNAKNYESDQRPGKPLTVTTSNDYKEQDSKYIVGPITVVKNNETPCTIALEVKNGEQVLSDSDYEILKDKTTKVTKDDLKAGGTFYLSIAQDKVTSKLSAKITTTYNTTTMTLWTNKDYDKEQPLVEVEKGPVSDEATIEMTPEEKEKVFDLALRKYITDITGSEFTQGPRTPQITDTNKIGENENKTDHTATYNHRKDPVTVKENDVIEYTINVYNEGTIDGRAKQIIDQLPTGLEYVEGSVSGDYKVDEGGYDKATNKLTLTKVNDDNIPAYIGTGGEDPSSNTVTIKCKVVATQQEKKQVLTNVAWISDDECAEEATDIDSSPSSSPDVNADGLVNENKDQYKGHGDNGPVTAENDYWKGQQDDDDFEKVVIPGTAKEEFADLALRKYITKVNGEDVDISRVPVPETSELASGSDTTATYNHRKNPVEVKVGDIVTYKITIYNEGDVEGKALKITDQLPAGMVLVDYEEEEPYDFENYGNGKKFTDDYYWASEYEEETNRVIFEDQPEVDEMPSNWKPSPNLQPYLGTDDIDSISFEYKCKVTGDVTGGIDGKVLTNVAWISEDFFTSDDVTDRDSQPNNTPQVNKDELVSTDPDSYKGKDSNDSVMPGDSNKYWEGQQDDDDFEKLIIPEEKELPFDLKLIKKIVEINGNEVEERLKGIDVSELNTGENGKTTADYDLVKDALPVKIGDLVKYTFTVYNEGYVDGYASKITEDIPEGLEFVWSDKTGEELENDGDLTDEEKAAIKFNQDMLWEYDEGLETISTTYLSKEKEKTPGENLIKAFGENDGTKTEEDLDSREVSVIFRVTNKAVSGKEIQNEAAITESKDSNGNPKEDRDSDTDEWVKHEDDEDYDKVVVEAFDLALRKFIIAVSHDTEIEDSEYLKNSDGTYSRAPEVDTSNLNKEVDGKLVTTATYNHTKEPVLVTAGDYVIYTLRVYNEGDVDGFAAEIKDHLPPYLEFVDNDFNKEFGWELESDNRTVVSTYLADQKIAKATENDEGEIELEYKDIQIMCKVTPDVQNNNKVTNIADVTKYEDENHNPAKDRDSDEDNLKVPDDKDFPSYKDDENGPYIPGQEDDDDFEKVVVKIFDLALRKWVSEIIVVEDGKEVVTQTGHQPYDDPEQTVKVELSRKKLNSTVVKFRYGIRVINEGDIEGYATEITDYIPEGLSMAEGDNPDWNYEGNNVATTRKLESKLLKPGEYADIDILLTWNNNEENLGLKTNTAEISEDKNEYGIPDIDSVPGNNKPGEDDIDDAPVILSIKTGQVRIYFLLGTVVLATLAGGIILIKKYVIK